MAKYLFHLPGYLMSGAAYRVIVHCYSSGRFTPMGIDDTLLEVNLAGNTVFLLSACLFIQKSWKITWRRSICSLLPPF